MVLAPQLDPPFNLDFTFGGWNFGSPEVLALIAVPLVVFALAVLLQRSDVGLAARASAGDADRAGLVGLPVGRVPTAVWAFAALPAFLAIPFRGRLLQLHRGSALHPALLPRPARQKAR